MTDGAGAGASPGVVMVTGADDGFRRCLAQFLLSVERRGLHERYRCIAYDLGLGSAMRGLLERRFAWCEFRTFGFDRHPAHVAPATGTYAWKPLIVAEVAEGHRGPLFWFDSATVLRTDLDEPIAAIRSGRSYVMRGRSPLRVRCDPRVARSMDVPDRHLDLPILFAGAFGLDVADPVVRRLVTRWAALAGDPAAFLPATEGHNADQTVLTILLYELLAAGEIALCDREIDISSAHPIRWMSSRNKVPGWFPLAADPLARAYFAGYKFLDRLNLRCRDWRDGFLAGERESR